MGDFHKTGPLEAINFGGGQLHSEQSNGEGIGDVNRPRVLQLTFLYDF